MDFSAARPPLFPLAAPVARELQAPGAPPSATALPASQAVPLSSKVEKPTNNARPKRPDGRTRGDDEGEQREGGSDAERRPPAPLDIGLAARSDDPRPPSAGETLLDLHRAFLKATKVELSGIAVNKKL